MLYSVLATLMLSSALSSIKPLPAPLSSVKLFSASVYSNVILWFVYFNVFYKLCHLLPAFLSSVKLFSASVYSNVILWFVYFNVVYKLCYLCPAFLSSVKLFSALVYFTLLCLSSASVSALSSFPDVWTKLLVKGMGQLNNMK